MIAVTGATGFLGINLVLRRRNRFSQGKSVNI